MLDNPLDSKSRSEKKKPWGVREKKSWLDAQRIQRSYYDDVVVALKHHAAGFEIQQYGALSHNPEKYPLFLAKNANWIESNPFALITGGVHGYETSGVWGALRFLQTEAKRYTQHLNIIVAPCISPWSYETINRWNANTIDPNRSFYPGSQCEESLAFMAGLSSLGINHPSKHPLVHIDLHETTDTDNTVFRPARSARDAIEQSAWSIPDGFYLVGDKRQACDEFHRAIIAAVKPVTHISPADHEGRIIGETITQEGVILYDTKGLGLCAGMTDSAYAVTTEVYPDSSRATPELCINAQIAAISGGLEYVLQRTS